VLKEEGEALGRGPFGGHDEVTLVLAFLVIGNDDDVPSAKVLYRKLNARHAERV
jgi:hypothetical protein